MSDKGIIRVAKTKGFTTLDNTACNDKRLSFKAVGIHTYLMTKPDNWQVFAVHLATTHKDGRDSVLAGLQELEKYGYLVRRTLRDTAGKITGRESVVYERPEISRDDPATVNREIRITDKPCDGKPDANKDLHLTSTEEQEKLTLAPDGARPKIRPGESLADFMARARPKGEPESVRAAKPERPTKVGPEIRQPLFEVVAPLLVGSTDQEAIKAAASQIGGVIKSLLAVDIVTPEEAERVGQYIRDQRPSGDDGVIRLQTWRERIPEYVGYRASGKPWPKFGTRSGRGGTQAEIEARVAKVAELYEAPITPNEPITIHEDDEENLCPAF